MRRLSAAFDEMEKAKQVAEDKSRPPSSSSSSFTSEVSDEIFQEDDLATAIKEQINEDKLAQEMTSSQTDDLLELGAEGNEKYSVVNEVE